MSDYDGGQTEGVKVLLNLRWIEVKSFDGGSASAAAQCRRETLVEFA